MFGWQIVKQFSVINIQKMVDPTQLVMFGKLFSVFELKNVDSLFTVQNAILIIDWCYFVFLACVFNHFAVEIL